MASHSLKRVRREGVSTQVFEQLKNQIIRGSWAKGEKLPSEGELAEAFGVSRVSIREALQRLAALGVLETRHGEGTFVKGVSTDTYLNSLFPALVLDPTDVFHVLEYRQIMEKGIVALVVEKATDEDIAELEADYAEMIRLQTSSVDFAHADLNFHLALAKATGNPVIYKVNSIIRDILTASMENIVTLLGTHDGLDYHKRILEAIRKRDSLTAQALMDEHVRRTVLRLKTEKGTDDERTK